MLILSIFTPLISAAIVGMFGRYLGFKGASIFTSCCAGITAITLVYFAIKTLIVEHHYYLKAYTWVNAYDLEIKWGILIDNLSLCMLLIVVIISFFVHVYSVSYMGEDPHLTRFMCYLSLFTFFMLVLITAPNLIQTLIGWEGVGICSYLLINFWFTRVQANKAAVKAVLVNRIGDFSLILGVACIYFLFKSLDFAIIFSLAKANSDKVLDFFFTNIYAINLIAILIFLGAVGKSAQIGLHTWLPDAMEGPTPVSALIHAATMVTAGVFLVIRCSYIFEYTNNVLLFVSLIGALTTVFAASSAIFQNDIKKVIAYSTCSQLGYMVLACGLSEYSLGLFHLMNHAFFKALLFLTAGSIIHIFHDEQDMRKMGGLLKLAPVSYMSLSIGSLAIIGFPYLSGFYSKDTIFELAFIKTNYFNNFIFWMAFSAALLTTFYSIKILYMVFLNRCGAYKSITYKIKESTKLLLFPLVGLAFISIFFGYICKDLLIGGGTNFLYASVLSNADSQSPIEYEYITKTIKTLPLWGTCAVLILFFRYFYKYSYDTTLFLILKTPHKMFTFLNKKWHFDELYNSYINLPLCYYGYNSILLCVEKGFVEFIGSKTISYIVNNSSIYLSRCSTGLLYDQIAIIFGYSLIISPILSLLY